MKCKWIFVAILTVLVLCGCAANETGPVIKEFEAYYTMNEPISITEEQLEMVHSGTVAITFAETSGPEVFQIAVLYKADSDGEFLTGPEFSLTLAESTSVQFPAGVVYQINATATEGKNGYVTFRVAVE